MNLVIVVQERNINIAAVLYKKKNNNITDNIKNPVKKNIFSFFLNNSFNLFFFNSKVLKFSGLLIKPLLLPIFKNLFFLWFKISLIQNFSTVSQDTGAFRRTTDLSSRQSFRHTAARCRLNSGSCQVVYGLTSVRCSQAPLGVAALCESFSAQDWLFGTALVTTVLTWGVFALTIRRHPQ